MQEGFENTGGRAKMWGPILGGWVHSPWGSSRSTQPWDWYCGNSEGRRLEIPRGWISWSSVRCYCNKHQRFIKSRDFSQFWKPVHLGLVPAVGEALWLCHHVVKRGLQSWLSFLLRKSIISLWGGLPSWCHLLLITPPPGPHKQHQYMDSGVMFPTHELLGDTLKP